MQNDAIVVEFRNRDGVEVLIDPRIVDRVGDALLTSATTVLPYLQAHYSVQGHINASILLAGAPRGSLKLLYKFVFQPTEQDIAKAQHWLTLLGIVGAVIGGIAYSIGALTPDREVSTECLPVLILANEVNRSDPNVVRAVTQLIERLHEANVDEVWLHIPEFPSSRVIGPVDMPAYRLGDLVPEEQKRIVERKRFSGVIELLGEMTELDDPSAERDPERGEYANARLLTLARTKIDDVEHFLLIEWLPKARTPVGIGDKLGVRGKLIALKDLDGLVPLTRVPPSFRLASACLQVRDKDRFTP